MASAPPGGAGCVGLVLQAYLRAMGFGFVALGLTVVALFLLALEGQPALAAAIAALAFALACASQMEGRDARRGERPRGRAGHP